MDLLEIKYNLNIKSKKVNMLNQFEDLIFNSSKINIDRIDGIFAFEIELAKNPNAKSWTIYFPVKYVIDENLSVAGKAYNTNLSYKIAKALNFPSGEDNHTEDIDFLKSSSDILSDFTTYFFKYYIDRRFKIKSPNLVVNSSDKLKYWKVTIYK